MSDASTFELGDLVLKSGQTLKEAKVVYQTYGELDEQRSNVIVYPTSFGAQHTDIEWLIGEGRILDSSKYFIVIPNMFTNGLSSSPSNTPFPYDLGRFPLVSIHDNVHAQARLLKEVYEVQRIQMVYGWSMGGQQAYHWGALYPDLVERICVVCSSARTAAHNQVFLEGVMAALTADSAYRDGWFWEVPHRGLRAMARVYAGWALSQRFYRQNLWEKAGYSSLEDYFVGDWERNFRRRDANDLLAQLRTWSACDLSSCVEFAGDLELALGSIKAQAVIMPCEQDMYFRVADNAVEMRSLSRGELRPFASPWGHRAGNPVFSPDDEQFLRDTVQVLLAS
jgi:homoserine O-acetyltransferase/O-succinyltransferase